MSGAIPLKELYDLAVIGAGPAGLAAATLAAELGIDTVLFDEQPEPGGQIYRAITTTPLTDRAMLGADYWYGTHLVDALRRTSVQYLAGATVWSISRDLEIGISLGGAARLTRARRVILATGALERPFPIEGWTLPGVMTAGAAQTLLKASGIVAEVPVVLAGSGPLLWLVAAQYLRAGAAIAAILDTTPAHALTSALPRLPPFLLSRYFGKGMSLLREVRGGVKVARGVTALRADGGDTLSAVTYRVSGGPELSMPAKLLLLHQGVVPNVNLANAIGCEHRWDERQLCFRPVVDAWGQSQVEGVAITGDGAGISGALGAEHQGRLAALDAALHLGRIDRERRDRDGTRHRHALGRAERGRAFLDRYFQPAKAFRVPSAQTIVCRCEEVTAQQIRDAVALGCMGPNQMKSFLRCGMGPCQGRLCGLTVSELIADARGVSPAEIGYYRLRPPVKPITLAELAALPKSEAAIQTVARR